MAVREFLNARPNRCSATLLVTKNERLAMARFTMPSPGVIIPNRIVTTYEHHYEVSPEGVALGVFENSDLHMKNLVAIMIVNPLLAFKFVQLITVNGGVIRDSALYATFNEGSERDSWVGIGSLDSGKRNDNLFWTKLQE